MKIFKGRQIWWVLGCFAWAACEGSDSGQDSVGEHSHLVAAADVSATAAGSVSSTNVQSWLETLLDLIEGQQTAMSELTSSITDHETRIGSLESNQTRTAPSTAAEVLFDDTKTTVQGANVQSFGESVDQQLLSMDSALDAVQETTDNIQNDISALQTSMITTTRTLVELDDEVTEVRYAKNILMESSADPESETNPAIPEDYPYDNRVRGAIRVTWDYLEPLIQLTSSPCPDEMVLVHDMVCVDKKQWTDGSTSTRIWTNAASKCMNAGKRLCSPNEFFAYCVFPADHFEPSEYSALDTLKNTEWMDQLSGPGFMAFAGSGKGCKDIAPVAADTFLHFRCCKTPTPITGSD